MVKMADENNPGVITRPSNIHGELGPRRGKLAEPVIGQNRRALSAINRNIIGGPPGHNVVLKRGSSIDQNAVVNKIPPIPIHRPITRKLAAQMATQQQQPAVQEPKPRVRPVPSSYKSEEHCVDDEIIDVDDDYPVPMSVQHTEAMLDEIDTMDAEFEMEVEDQLVDIDSHDKKNPLAVTEYINDIYSYYRIIETSSKLHVSPDYMFQQPDINDRMRSILIDWLIEVHYKFELMEETLYLTVNLIDRYLARASSIVRKKLQLVGITAMLLACKYEEISVPVVEDFIFISDRAYSRDDVLEMESLMLNTLQFNLSVPTPFVFMKRFLKAAQSDKKLEFLSFFIIELSLVEYEMLRFPPSLLAAAAIFTAQCSLSGCKNWNKTCEKHSNYTQEQLLQCSKLMVTFHQKAGTGKHTAVHRKYSTSKYGFAAKTSQPALFLLDAAFMDSRYCMH